MPQGASYRAALHLDVCYQKAGGGAVHRFNRRFGLLPIMVKSQVCYLENLDRRALPPAAELIRRPACCRHSTSCIGFTRLVM